MERIIKNLEFKIKEIENKVKICDNANPKEFYISSYGWAEIRNEELKAIGLEKDLEEIKQLSVCNHKRNFILWMLDKTFKSYDNYQTRGKLILINKCNRCGKYYVKEIDKIYK